MYGSHTPKAVPSTGGDCLTLIVLNWYHAWGQSPSQLWTRILGLPGCHLSLLVCYLGKHKAHPFACEKLKDILYMPVPRTHTSYLISSQENLVEVVGIIFSTVISITLTFSFFWLIVLYLHPNPLNNLPHNNDDDDNIDDTFLSSGR